MVLFGLALSTVFPFNRIEKTSEPKLMPTRVPISMQIKEPITLERFGEIVQRVENAVEPLRATLRFSDVYSFYNEQGWGAVMLVLPRELATEEYAAKVREAVKPLLPVIPGVEMALRDRMFWRGRGGGGGGDRNITLALRGNGEIWVGATEEEAGFLPGVTAGDIADLGQAAQTLVPSLTNARFIEARSGFRPTTPDYVPLIGEAAPGLIVATGHWRKGVMFAAITARLVRQAILGELPEIDLAPFSPLRFFNS